MADRLPPEGAAWTPSPRSRALSRRSFLARSALTAAAVPSLGAFLEACSKAPGGSTSTGGASPTSLTLAAPDHPVLWPIATDNAPLASTTAPEQNATLQLYNYADYIDPNAIKSFEKKYKQYNVKVSVSTFNDTDEAITKIRSGKVPYDIYFPSYDQISKMVEAKLIRPLTHSWIPNITNVWESFQNPWYDEQWRYTVPYTVYTTGIGWRTDQVPADIAGMPNPYEVFWDPQYKGKIAVIDDWHTAMALPLLRNGITNINTTDPKQIALIGTQLTAMIKSDKPKVTITMYNDLPAGQLGICQMWSGDVVNALSYLPKGTPASVLRYWFPSDGKGMVDNDLMVCLSGGKNPVLAQLFMNHMLDPDVAQGNFSFIGYQPPQRSINPSKLVADKFLPENLASATVLEEYFKVGIRLLELPPATDLAWHQVWQEFKAGG